MLIERKTWSVHFVMEAKENSVQNIDEEAKNAGKAKRSQTDKVGKLKDPLEKANNSPRNSAKSS